MYLIVILVLLYKGFRFDTIPYWGSKKPEILESVLSSGNMVFHFELFFKSQNNLSNGRRVLLLFIFENDRFCRNDDSIYDGVPRSVSKHNLKICQIC